MSIGCRHQTQKSIYHKAEKAAKYLKQRDGNCLIHNTPLSVSDFRRLFPKIDLEIFHREPSFNIQLTNSSIFSIDSYSPVFCRIIEFVEKKSNFFGPSFLVIIIGFSWIFFKAQRQKKLLRCKKLANHALRLLSSTNKSIYIYDMKVQLRHQEKNIDSLWRSIVKFVEEDSSILVGAAGDRRNCYWKWIH